MVDGPDTQAWLNAVNDKPGDQSAYYFANDELEAQKFNEFYPSSGAGSNATPWWAALATYGATRAIDAAVGPKIATNGAATYAGQNGQTYAQGQAVNDPGSNLLLMGLIGLVLYAAAG